MPRLSMAFRLASLSSKSGSPSITSSRPIRASTAWAIASLRALALIAHSVPVAAVYRRGRERRLCERRIFGA